MNVFTSIYMAIAPPSKKSHATPLYIYVCVYIYVYCKKKEKERKKNKK